MDGVLSHPSLDHRPWSAWSLARSRFCVGGIADGWLGLQNWKQWIVTMTRAFWLRILWSLNSYQLLELKPLALNGLPKPKACQNLGDLLS